MIRARTLALAPQGWARLALLAAWLGVGWLSGAHAAPRALDDQFELPLGFHIYRIATPELTGGSYELCFDGEGRLLVGDGEALRRLADKDADGVFDSFEVIATSLGWRGPQGILVYGDRLYAVGGDGVQLYEGYRTGRLVHRGRIGAPFSTGGDHDAHCLFRGHDGWIYLMAGNGAGIEGRRHITEPASPCWREREASVFRFSPDGARWECLATGGRNPPGLGLHYTGDLFSFDSDMEWHVGLPWYRPVRLNQWVVGSDLGWQEVGAYPPYYLDTIPGVLDVGRGSPTGATFYEHQQFPLAYRDAFLACDYRWKKESTDGYTTRGRLVAFHLLPMAAGWRAEMEVLVRPRPGAIDAEGRPIYFALVDVEVAPDGSAILSDHNQGLWRLVYTGAPMTADSGVNVWPALVPAWPRPEGASLATLLALPQPLSERTRLREEELKTALGRDWSSTLEREVLRTETATRSRLRALQLLAPQAASLSERFLARVAQDPQPELRGNAAWLVGLHGGEKVLPLLANLLDDSHPWVRRRAAEALNRGGSRELTRHLVRHLEDSDRLVAYTCMRALEHRPPDEWRETVWSDPSTNRRRRALVAAFEQDPGFRLPPETATRPFVEPRDLTARPVGQSDPNWQLDRLRAYALVLGRPGLSESDRQKLRSELWWQWDESDPLVRWESVRVRGQHQLGSPKTLLDWLLAEQDRVTQFHLAEALARFPDPLQVRDGATVGPRWDAADSDALFEWFLSTQRGWFAEFDAKGVEFPAFWQTVLANYAAHHRSTLLGALKRLDLGSLLGNAALGELVKEPGAAARLAELYRDQTSTAARRHIARAARQVPDAALGQLLLSEHAKNPEPELRAALLEGLEPQPVGVESLPVFRSGLQVEPNEAARAAARALARLRPELDASLADELITALTRRSGVFHSFEFALVTLSGRHRADYRSGGDLNRWVDRPERDAGVAFWKQWYRDRFGREFVATARPGGAVERTDEVLRQRLLELPLTSGDRQRGAVLYERLQCHTCHAGGLAPGREGRLFGPDLAGVTRRLSREQLAEAVVYPSRTVADRFRATLMELKDGTQWTGFITETANDFITLATPMGVQRIARPEVLRQSPQPNSLMPDRLLATLTDTELTDLLTFLDRLGTP